MHVLAIHMKVMAPRQQLSDEWAALTGLWVTLDNQGKLMLKDDARRTLDGTIFFQVAEMLEQNKLKRRGAIQGAGFKSDSTRKEE